MVGQAEQYDEFEAENLEVFQKSLIQEEKQSQQMDQALRTLQEQTSQDQNATPALPENEVSGLTKELLRFPGRDRVKFGLDGQHTYDSNIHRLPLRHEKGDSVFDSLGFVEFDVGGQKTDLRLETRGAKQWNIHYPTSDFWYVEERIRYRRKYFKKITHSVQSRLARHSSKTVEIDSKKVRWDSHQNTAFNYAFSRKLSVNTEFNWLKRMYTTEAFDQDSDWQAEAAPSAFWNVTPKSRVSLGYRFGASRIATKTGDSNTQQIHLGYFGRVTRKSSISFDLAYSYQQPRSQDTPIVHTIKIGKGFIWQLTPKSQMAIQFIRSLQNSSSDKVADTENETTKGDAYFTNDSLSISLNSRLTRKITAILNLNASHFRNKVKDDDEEDGETRQFMFPVSLQLDYMLRRYLYLRLRYTFTYRTGDEKNDKFKSHILTSGMSLFF